MAKASVVAAKQLRAQESTEARLAEIEEKLDEVLRLLQGVASMQPVAEGEPVSGDPTTPTKPAKK
jgi:hypothetical protein